MLHLWPYWILFKGLKHSRCWGQPFRWLVAQVGNAEKREGAEDWGREKDEETERGKDPERAGSLWLSAEQLQKGMRPFSPHSPDKICTICSSDCAVQFWQTPLCIILWGKMMVIIIKCSHPKWVCRGPRSLLQPAESTQTRRGVEGLRGPLDVWLLAVSLTLHLLYATWHVTHMCP